jgi:hypothetical protein
MAICIPFALITIFSVLVIWRLIKSGPKINQEEQRKRRQNRLCYLVLAIVMVYIIFQFPLWYSQFWLRYFNGQRKATLMQDISKSLLFSHAAINPIFFAYFTKDFVAHLKSLIMIPFRLCKTKSILNN